MKPEIRDALKSFAETRQAFNALAEDAPESDVTERRKAVEAADQVLIDALAKATETPAELRSKIRVGRYLGFLANQKELDGAEAEFNKEIGMRSDHFPVQALAPMENEDLETRADAISPQNAAGQPLASGAINTTTGPMLNRVFKATDAAFLGVAMPTVPPGLRTYPVMVDGTTAGMVARGAALDAGAARFDTVNVSPKRGTVGYTFDVEGVAELGGGLESTMRSDMRTAIGYMMDLQILNGDGADANISGIVKELELELPPGRSFANNDVDQALSWANGKQIATDGLDGFYSRTEADLRMLIGGTTYSQARGLYRTNDSEMDLLQEWASLGTAVRRSFQIADPAFATIKGKNANGTKKVQSAIVNSEPGAAVAPIWSGISAIRDPYTKAREGQIMLTMTVLYNFVFRRKAGWHRYAIRTDA